MVGVAFYLSILLVILLGASAIVFCLEIAVVSTVSASLMLALIWNCYFIRMFYNLKKENLTNRE